MAQALVLGKNGRGCAPRLLPPTTHCVRASVTTAPCRNMARILLILTIFQLGSGAPVELHGDERPADRSD
eukprot:7916481-Alexandrium_andersonii.AAC.1